MRYAHAVRVLDNGNLQAQCRADHTLHWFGTEHSQDSGLAQAHVAANAELDEHVRDTNHSAAKNRHGKR